MNTLRLRGGSWLVAAGLALGSGCATASHDTYTALNDGSGLVKRQPPPTEGMNPMEKTGYYLGWLSLSPLYALAGGSAPLLPP